MTMSTFTEPAFDPSGSNDQLPTKPPGGAMCLLSSCTDDVELHSDSASIESIQTIAYNLVPQIVGATAVARPPVGPVSLPPLTALIAATHSSKRTFLEPGEACTILSPYLFPAIQRYPKLSSAISLLGWSEGTGWTRSVDLLGLSCILKKFKYVCTAQLGAGSYGCVFKATDVETGEQLAIKKVAARLSSDDCTLPYCTLREVTVLRELRHPHLVRLRELIGCPGSNHLYLVMDYMDCDLRQFLNTTPQASSRSIIKAVMWQILQGLAYLHANCIFHRDLKPQNVLVNKATCHVRISDFGLSRAFVPPSKAYSPKVATLYYRAPELLLGVSEYGPAVDMWAVGCIMAELLNFWPLFKEDTEVGVIMSVFKTLGTPTETQWPGIDTVLQSNFGGPVPQIPRRDLSATIPALKDDPLVHDLVSGLLAYDPKQRLTAAAALRHPWFNSVRKAASAERAASVRPLHVDAHMPDQGFTVGHLQQSTEPAPSTAATVHMQQDLQMNRGPNVLKLPPLLPHLTGPMQTRFRYKV